MRTALVAALAAVALPIAGCSSTIEPDYAAQTIVDFVKKQTGFEPKDVKCPKGVEAKVGGTFQCTFTGREATEYTADMRITKVDGDDVEFYIETKPSS